MRTDLDRLRKARGGWLTGLVAVVLFTVAACGSGGGGNGNSGGSNLHGTLTVLAAASLNGAFNRIGMEFHQANPGVDVRFSFAGSSALVTQIKQGVQGDIFASADSTNMQAVTSAGMAQGDPAVLAHNELEILTEHGNPMHIQTVADLANPNIKVALCAPAVPCGAYAAQLFQNAGVMVTPVTQETSVSGVVTTVTLGEADAGIVYKTDVKAAGDKGTGVAIPAYLNVLATLSIVELKDAPNQQAAHAFLDFLKSDKGRTAMQDFGFTPPTAS